MVVYISDSQEHLVDIYIINVELNQNSEENCLESKPHSFMMSYYLVFPQHVLRQAA